MLIQLPELEVLKFVRDIAKDDWMMRKDRPPEWYFKRGFGALAFIAYECQRARLGPASILDFGCGHGCVTRMLKAYYPKARLVGQDVNPEWMQWCSDVLGIETIVSAPTIEEVVLDESQFDVIWAGSVFSHIPEKAAVHLLKQFKRALSKSGIAIFSTAGQIMRNGYRPGSISFLSDVQIENSAAAFDRGRYGFGNYNKSAYEDWGHSLTPYNWFFEKSIELDFPLCGFYEAGWGMVQDVYAMRKEKSQISWP